eukprot:EG_transcript_8853
MPRCPTPRCDALSSAGADEEDQGPSSNSDFCLRPIRISRARRPRSIPSRPKSLPRAKPAAGKGATSTLYEAFEVLVRQNPAYLKRGPASKYWVAHRRPVKAWQQMAYREFDYIEVQAAGPQPRGGYRFRAVVCGRSESPGSAPANKRVVCFDDGSLFSLSLPAPNVSLALCPFRLDIFAADVPVHCLPAGRPIAALRAAERQLGSVCLGAWAEMAGMAAALAGPDRPCVYLASPKLPHPLLLSPDLLLSPRHLVAHFDPAFLLVSPAPDPADVRADVSLGREARPVPVLGAAGLPPPFTYLAHPLVLHDRPPIPPPLAPPAAQLAVAPQGERGWGVVCRDAVPRGTYIGTYCGLYMDHAVGQEIGAVCDRDGRPNYMVRVGDEEVDGGWLGNVTRFINHSCDPNLDNVGSWRGTGPNRHLLVELYARVDLPAMAELTWDYGREYFELSRTCCLCGSASCRYPP